MLSARILTELDLCSYGAERDGSPVAERVTSIATPGIVANRAEDALKMMGVAPGTFTCVGRIRIRPSQFTGQFLKNCALSTFEVRSLMIFRAYLRHVKQLLTTPKIADESSRMAFSRLLYSAYMEMERAYMCAKGAISSRKAFRLAVRVALRLRAIGFYHTCEGTIACGLIVNSLYCSISYVPEMAMSFFAKHSRVARPLRGLVIDTLRDTFNVIVSDDGANLHVMCSLLNNSARLLCDPTSPLRLRKRGVVKLGNTLEAILAVHGDDTRIASWVRFFRCCVPALRRRHVMTASVPM